MKKLILFLLVFVSLNCFGQDTTRPFLDTIKGAVLVVPKVVNVITHDTCYQFTWNVTLSSDTSHPSPAIVIMYDRKRNRVYYATIQVPTSVINNWALDDTIIDDYILTYYGLVKK